MVVLLDGECTMCSCFGQFVSAFDPTGVFRFASQQSLIGDTLMEHCEGAKAHALQTILVCDVIEVRAVRQRCGSGVGAGGCVKPARARSFAA